MSRRAFNQSEFLNTMLENIAMIKNYQAEMQKIIGNLELMVQVAAKMAEQKLKKEVKADDNGD